MYRGSLYEYPSTYSYSQFLGGYLLASYIEEEVRRQLSQFLGGYLARYFRDEIGDLGTLNSLADTCLPISTLTLGICLYGSQFLGGYLSAHGHKIPAPHLPSQFLGGYLAMFRKGDKVVVVSQFLGGYLHRWFNGFRRVA